MESTLYFILDSRSIFFRKREYFRGVEDEDNIMVTGTGVWSSMVRFSRLYNIKGGRKKKTSIYLCDSNGYYLVYEGYISNLTVDMEKNKLIDKLSEYSSEISLGDMLLSSVISKCLCKINQSRRNSFSKSVEDRIIVIDASKKDDYISQYVSLLNAGFASQKLGVVVDILSVSREPSSLLSNFADICNGLNLNYKEAIDSVSLEYGAKNGNSGYFSVYNKERNDQGLTAFLIFHFLPSIEARDETFIRVNRTKQTGFVVCFCHHDKIDIGYVCSSCLSIFCSLFRAPICSTCG
ncbi:hypothetical protein FG386_001301 [Cryptosporidium ryanae]|uniref:uncharacterized protein n=1 Tax=Cryptosporidium ryanae TaxID=515981 RepID=UPI00351A77B8|nr:hypothetical protein FG386_001301 [Cryptosporidium ryanae]